MPRILRNGSLSLASLALLLLQGCVCRAQMHHVEAPQRVTRAVGVYEWTGELAKPSAARFVPVSLFIGGHFEDAGLYLARPVPFAIEPGDVYALEHAGEPEGLLDVDYAKRVVTGNALADDNPEGAWYAFGKFTPEAAPRITPLRPSRHLQKIQSSAGPTTPPGTKLPSGGDEDDKPHLERRDTTASGGQPPGSAGSTRTSASDSRGAATPPASSSSGDEEDDPDRPTLRRRDPAQDAARRREYGKKGTQASVTAAGPALGDDPDRPILGRSTGEEQETPELTGIPSDMHQTVAVSDATHIDEHPFARAWDSPAERAATLNLMEALAKPRLAAYLAESRLVPSDAPLVATASGAATAPPASMNAAAGTPSGSPPRLQRGVPEQYRRNGSGAAAPAAPSKAGTPPKAGTPKRSASRTAAHRSPRAAAKPISPPLTLGQETLAGFLLSYGGLPTFVYTAEASIAPASGIVTSTMGTPRVAYVTVVAQRLPTGNLQVALSSATDGAHLDRTPRLRLIDAVDPDDSHRASLLFELRGNSSREFALYRFTSAQAEQTFTTAAIE